MEFVETGGHAAGVATLSFLPAEETSETLTIVTAGGDGVLHFHDARNIMQDPKTVECQSALLDVAVSTEGDLVATADEDGTVSLFKKSADGSFSLDTDVTRFRLSARTLGFSTSDRFLAAGGDDGIIRIVNVMDRSAATDIAPNVAVKSLAYDPKEDFLAAYLVNGTVCIYDVGQDYQAIFEAKDVAPKMTTDSTVLGRMSWFPGSGKHLAIPATGKVMVLIRESWSESYSLVGQHKHPVSVVSYCPNGKYLISADQAMVVVWDIMKRTPIQTHLPRAAISGFSWSPITNSVAMMDTDGFLFMCNSAVPSSMAPPVTCLEVTEKEAPLIDDIIEREALAEENEGAEDDLEDVDEGLDDWLDDDTGEYKKDLAKERAEEDRMLQEALQKETPQIQLCPRQPAFQPSASTDPEQKRKFLAWNLTGQIVTRNEDSYHTVEVEFSDLTLQKPHHIRDHRAFSLGTMDPNGALFASQEQGPAAAVISYRPFHSVFATHSEWSKELAPSEAPLVLAVSRKWCAVATSKQMVRHFTTFGADRGMFCLPGPVVTMAAHGPYLAVVYHGVQAFEGQNLQYTLYDLESGMRIVQDSLPLTPQATLKWMGYSSTGMLSTYDSAGVVRVMMEHKGWQWMPVLETVPLRKAATDSHWVVGVTAEHVMAVICRAGRSDPLPTNPRPFIDAIPIQVPLVLQDEQTAALEHDLFLKQLNMGFEEYRLERDDETKNLSNDKLKIDMKTLTLMQVFMKAQREGRAFELALHLSHPKFLQNAIQLARANNLTTLAERIEQVLENQTEPRAEQPVVEHQRVSGKRPHENVSKVQEEEEEEAGDAGSEMEFEDQGAAESDHEETQPSQRVMLSPLRPHTRASPVKRPRVEASDEHPVEVRANPFAKSKREPLSASRAPRPGMFAPSIAKSLGSMNPNPKSMSAPKKPTPSMKAN